MAGNWHFLRFQQCWSCTPQRKKGEEKGVKKMEKTVSLAVTFRARHLFKKFDVAEDEEEGERKRERRCEGALCTPSRAGRAGCSSTPSARARSKERRSQLAGRRRLCRPV